MLRKYKRVIANNHLIIISEYHNVEKHDISCYAEFQVRWALQDMQNRFDVLPRKCCRGCSHGTDSQADATRGLSSLKFRRHPRKGASAFANSKSKSESSTSMALAGVGVCWMFASSNPQSSQEPCASPIKGFNGFFVLNEGLFSTSVPRSLYRALRGVLMGFGVRLEGF